MEKAAGFSDPAAVYCDKKQNGSCPIPGASFDLEGRIMTRSIRTSTMIGGLLLGVLLCLGLAVGAEPTAGNQALRLNGQSDFIRVADSQSLHSFTSAITIEAWFKASSFALNNGEINCILRKDVAEGDEDFFLRFRTIDGRAWVEMSPGYEIGTLRTDGNFQIGKWHHLATTYDGHTITAYVNGVKIGSENASGEMAIDKADLFIGKGDPEFSSGEYFHGVLDEIRLWNVARSEQEIRTTMNARLTGKEKGLVAYWNFDDGTANDQSGHGNHGFSPLVTESPWPDPQAAAEPVAKPAAAQAEASQAGARERARDRVVHIEEGIIREIPQVVRPCDGMDIRKEKVDIGDCKLYCEQEGQGTPVVLLHGGPGATHIDFHPCFSRAAGFARVIYYDQRGCGQSDFKPGKGYCLDQAVDDLDALRRTLGLDQWVVLGHSYGGLLAQCYAMKYPERVKGLVLVCASTGLHGRSMPSREQEFISQQERNKMAQIGKTPGLSTAQIIYNNFLNGDWKRQSYYKPTREQIAQGALYGWVHDDNFNGIMSRSANAADLTGCFAQCPIPTLIVEGAWDMSWNTDKPQRLAANHPNAQLVLFEESGHNPFEDEPTRFFGLLKDFLGTLREAPALQLAYWKDSISARGESPAVLVSHLGWGRRSNQEIASKYDKAWLDQIADVGTWLKIGFALYDVKRYDDALTAFQKMEELANTDERGRVLAMIWQGHMLDLLGRRQEAIAEYRKAADVGIEDGEQRHDQFGLAYSPTPYAKERMTTPFTRVENTDPN
jgi:proline-specific peptidase